MKNIHIISTDKPSRLVLETKNSNLFITSTYFKNDLMKHQNIYITFNEFIEEGDFGLNISTKNIIQYDGIKGLDSYYKKIILTTDQELIEEGVQAIDDIFLEWFIKNPGCESVEVEEIFNLGKSQVIENGKIEYTKAIIPISYKILIPNKQETLEEAAETWVFETNGHKWSNNDGTAGDNYGSFKKGAKWQAEGMYSEEDMKLAFEAGHKKGFSCYPNTDTFKEFIQSLKQHKS